MQVTRPAIPKQAQLSDKAFCPTAGRNTNNTARCQGLNHVLHPYCKAVKLQSTGVEDHQAMLSDLQREKIRNEGIASKAIRQRNSMALHKGWAAAGLCHLIGIGDPGTPFPTQMKAALAKKAGNGAVRGPSGSHWSANPQDWPHSFANFPVKSTHY